MEWKDREALIGDSKYPMKVGAPGRPKSRGILSSMICRGLLILMFAMVLLGSSLCFILREGPSHASCRVDWTFNEDCESLAKSIMDQISKWNGSDCGSGDNLNEKCKYKMLSYKSSVLKATHTTPTKEYVDDLQFNFKAAGKGCAVHGFSTSETWYAYLDYSTNYCNLHNLITGAGLDKLDKYTETTSNQVCTQYSSANCERY